MTTWSSLTCNNAILGPGSPDWRANISKALSCKLFSLDGRQQVDGVDAIKLTSRPRRGIPIREAVWLDPSTYLPVQVSVTYLAAHGPGSIVVHDYHWLPPTRANLAALHASSGMPRSRPDTAS